MNVKILEPGQLVQIFNKGEDQKRFFEGDAIIVKHVSFDQYLVQFRENEKWQPVQRQVVIDEEWMVYRKGDLTQKNQLL